MRLNNLASVKEGVFIERLNQFTCLVETAEGYREKAYLPNSGRLKELLTRGAECLITLNRARLPYRLTAVKNRNI